MNTTNDHQPDEGTVNKVVESLDASADNLDGQTLSRLNQARQQALATPRKPWYSRYLLPTGSIAVAATLVLAIVIGPQNAPITAMPVELASTEALELDEMALFAEDIDMLADLEMLEWFGEMAGVYDEAYEEAG